jgi:hypothetical protein
MTGDAVRLVGLNLLFLAAGLGVTAAAGFWRTYGVSRALGVSYLAGVAVYGVIAQFLYVCGASLVTWQVIAICGVLSSGVLFARGFRTPRVRRFAGWQTVAAGGVVAMLLLLAVDLWFQPLWAYDSWTFWTPKAHALWALGGLDAGWFTQADLTSRDYPILLPAVEAAGFRFTGFGTSLLDLQSLLFFAAFLRALYELLAETAEPVVLWAVLAMLAVAPSVADQVAAAEADVPVAVFFAIGGVCAALWLRDRAPGALAMAAVFAAGAAATKVEGFAFAVALFVVLAAVAGHGRRRDAGLALAAGVIALAAGILPWRIWLASHHVPNQASSARLTDAGFLVHHATRAPIAAGYMLYKMLDPRAWLLVLPLFAVVAGKPGRRVDRSVVAFACGTAVLAFAGLLLAYWSTRLGLSYQLKTSARRVVTGVVFFSASMTPLLADRA